MFLTCTLPHINTCLKGHLTLWLGDPDPKSSLTVNFGGFRHCGRGDRMFFKGLFGLKGGSVS